MDLTESRTGGTAPVVMPGHGMKSRLRFPANVRIFGTLHGAVFLVYVLLTVLVAIRLKWRLGRTTIFALLAAVPPFMTVAFEVWARRTGRLPQPAAAPSPTPAL